MFAIILVYWKKEKIITNIKLTSIAEIKNINIFAKYVNSYMRNGTD